MKRRGRSIPYRREAVDIVTSSTTSIMDARSSPIISHNGDESIEIGTISSPDFEVSCAVGTPSKSGFWFGSDDGRIQFISSDGITIIGPYGIALSRKPSTALRLPASSWL